MAKYLDKSQWEDQILIPDEQTPILGGQPEWDSTNMLSGWSNVPAAILADRTRFLLDKILEVEQEVGQGSENSLQKDNNLSDLQDVGQAKFNLGLNLVDNVRDVDKPVSTTTQTALNSKVDKEAGKGLSDVNFTEAYKQKLDAVEEHYKGLFTDEASLIAGVSSPVAGDYADVDASSGQDVSRYIWDVNDSKWVKQSGEVAPLTSAQVKTLYEANADTNAFTDDDKAKLSSIPEEASKPQILEGVGDVYVSGLTYQNLIAWNDLGSVSTNTTINLDTSLNHKLTATASLTIDASNNDAGKTGDIIISTPSAVTISWNTKWKFLGAVPNIGGAGGTWVVSYKVFDASNIYASAAKVA